VVAQVTALLATARESGVGYVVTAPAACGKTMLLKRVAFELATAGHPVVWLTPWAIPERAKVLRRLFELLAGTPLAKGRRVVVVIDDPVGGGTIARDSASAARGADVPFLLLAAVRTSDWHTWDAGTLTGNLVEVTTYPVADSLDDAEWAALPDYLVTLGIAADPGDAASQVTAAARREVRDTLSLLYFLLPQTRAAIAGGVRQEYNRLDDATGLRSFLLGGVRATPNLLKRAYDYVAVANRYKASLPLEVLVAALEVDYDSWVDATRGPSAVWGFLYALESDELQTVLYRTRNDVVTALIVEMLNGGSLGHSGELAVLRKLLEACGRGSHPAYGDFARRVLVPHEKLKHLDFPDGLALYDTTLAALRYPCRTLLHHKGLWVKNVGRDPVAAIRVLEAALATPATPYADRTEADEHINTSLAATKLEALKRGRIPLEEGKVAILGHLANARSEDFFNPKSVHVQANLISELVDQLPRDQPGDFLALVNQSVADIDRTVLTLNGLAKDVPDVVRDIDLLRSKQDELLGKITTLEELERLADDVWVRHRSQEGFILLARAHYAEAQRRDKKYERAYSSAQRAVALAEAAGIPPAPGLLAVAVEVYYHWQVQRPRSGPGGRSTGACWPPTRGCCSTEPRWPSNPSTATCTG
jgi:hypothetical protein